MNCQKCGKELDVFDRYCSYCGTKVEGQKELVINHDIEEPKNSFNKATIFGVASILCILLTVFVKLGIYFMIGGIILGYYTIEKANQEKRKNNYSNSLAQILGYLGLFGGIGLIIYSLLDFTFLW